MSRQELAEAVNAHVYLATGRVSAMNAHYVSRLERGIRRYPTADYRKAFRAVLGADTDAELGFVAPASTPYRECALPAGILAGLMRMPGLVVVVLSDDLPADARRRQP